MIDTPTPLPPPTGYDSWLDLAIDHEQLHSVRIPARAELEQLRQTIKHNASDWAEDHTHAQEVCKRFLPDSKVDGDSYGVPGIQDLVDMLAVELAALREALKGVVRHLGNGSAVSADSSTEFLCQVPNEVALCVGGLRRELSALREATRWRDASKERPEKETYYLAVVPYYSQPVEAWWDNKAGWLKTGVTHWLPIPEPTKEPCSSQPPDLTS